MFFNPYERILCQTPGLHKNVTPRRKLLQQVRGVDHHIKRFQPYALNNQLQSCQSFRNWWQFFTNRPKSLSYADQQRQNRGLCERVKNQNFINFFGENETIQTKIDLRQDEDFKNFFPCTNLDGCSSTNRPKRRRKYKIKVVQRPITMKYTVKTLSELELDKSKRDSLDFNNDGNNRINFRDIVVRKSKQIKQPTLVDNDSLEQDSNESLKLREPIGKSAKSEKLLYETVKNELSALIERTLHKKVADEVMEAKRKVFLNARKTDSSEPESEKSMKAVDKMLKLKTQQLIGKLADSLKKPNRKPSRHQAKSGQSLTKLIRRKSVPSMKKPPNRRSTDSLILPGKSGPSLSRLLHGKSGPSVTRLLRGPSRTPQLRGPSLTRLLLGMSDHSLPRLQRKPRPLLGKILHGKTTLSLTKLLETMSSQSLMRLLEGKSSESLMRLLQGSSSNLLNKRLFRKSDQSLKSLGQRISFSDSEIHRYSSNSTVSPKKKITKIRGRFKYQVRPRLRPKPIEIPKEEVEVKAEEAKEEEKIVVPKTPVMNQTLQRLNSNARKMSVLIDASEIDRMRPIIEDRIPAIGQTSVEKSAVKRNAEMEKIRENLDNLSQTKSVLSLKTKLPNLWSGLLDRKEEELRMRNSILKLKDNYQRGVIKSRALFTRKTAKRFSSPRASKQSVPGPESHRVEPEKLHEITPTLQYTTRLNKLENILRINKFSIEDNISNESVETVLETQSQKPYRPKKKHQSRPRKTTKTPTKKSTDSSIYTDTSSRKSQSQSVHSASSIFDRIAVRNSVLSRYSRVDTMYPMYSFHNVTFPSINVEEYVANYLDAEDIDCLNLSYYPKNWPTDFESDVVRRYRRKFCENEQINKLIEQLDCEQIPKVKKTEKKVRKIKVKQPEKIESSEHNCEICNSLCQTKPDPPYIIEMQKKQEREHLKMYYRCKLIPPVKTTATTAKAKATTTTITTTRTTTTAALPKTQALSEKAKILTRKLILCYKMLSNCRSIVDYKLKEHRCTDRCL